MRRLVRSTVLAPTRCPSYPVLPQQFPHMFITEQTIYGPSSVLTGPITSQPTANHMMLFIRSRIRLPLLRLAAHTRFIFSALSRQRLLVRFVSGCLVLFLVICALFAATSQAKAIDVTIQPQSVQQIAAQVIACTPPSGQHYCSGGNWVTSSLPQVSGGDYLYMCQDVAGTNSVLYYSQNTMTNQAATNVGLEYDSGGLILSNSTSLSSSDANYGSRVVCQLALLSATVSAGASWTFYTSNFTFSDSTATGVQQAGYFRVYDLKPGSDAANAAAQAQNDNYNTVKNQDNSGAAQQTQADSQGSGDATTLASSVASALQANPQSCVINGSADSRLPMGQLNFCSLPIPASIATIVSAVLSLIALIVSVMLLLRTFKIVRDFRIDGFNPVSMFKSDLSYITPGDSIPTDEIPVSDYTPTRDDMASFQQEELDFNNGSQPHFSGSNDW